MILPITEGESKGAHVVRFIETFLVLGKSHLGAPFLLEQWQKDVIHDIYRVGEGGKRKHRAYLLGLPRKNGKSQLGAALALYHLIADTADSGPEVYSAAGDREQARLVFTEAKRMVEASPDLLDVCTVYRNEILCNLNNGKYKAVSADAGLQQGLNPSFVIVDELHVHKTMDLYDAMTMGSGARNEPLVLTITTAGFDSESPLGKLYAHGKRVRSGEADDPFMGITWYGPDDDEEFDPLDEDNWRKWNPATFINYDDMRSNAHRTQGNAAFIRYRLNGWTASESAWLPNGVWAQRESDARLADGDEIVMGFDGAWKGDSTALVGCRLSDLHMEVLGHWECPPNDPHYRTPIEDVKSVIRAQARRFHLRELAADPYRFEQSLMELAEEGIPIVEYPTNSPARMIPATTAFYSAVVDGTLSHDGDVALARHMGNAILKEDARGGRITKDHKMSSKKIDLAIAAVIAHHRAVAYRENEEPEARMILL